MVNQTTIILKKRNKRIGKFGNNGRKICSFEKGTFRRELLILLKSVIEGERLLKKRKREVFLNFRNHF